MEEQFNLEEIFKDFLTNQSMQNLQGQIVPGAQTAAVGPVGSAPQSKFSFGENGNALATAGSNLLGAALGGEKKYNQKFVDSNANVSKSLERELTANNIRSNVTTAASAIPLWGPIIKAADSVSQGVDKATKDEYGIYKSGFAKFADQLFDPIGTITDMFSGGTTKVQQERIRARDHMFAVQENEKIAGERQAGNIVKNNLPNYQAPSYGRQGMSFKTKFASHGR